MFGDISQFAVANSERSAHLHNTSRIEGKSTQTPSFPTSSNSSAGKFNRNSTCPLQDLRCVLVDPDCPVLGLRLPFRTPCQIQHNRTVRSLSVNQQRAQPRVVFSAKQIPLPQPQPVDCLDQAPTPRHLRQRVRSVIQILLEELLSLAVVAGLAALAAATYLVADQITPGVVLVGALVKRRAIILLEDYSAVDRQSRKKMHLHRDLLASLPQANRRNQQPPDPVKLLVFSVAQPVPEITPLVTWARIHLWLVSQLLPHQPANPPQISLGPLQLLPDHPQAPMLAVHRSCLAVNPHRMQALLLQT